MNHGHETNLNVSTFEKHHRQPDGTLVICDGTDSGLTLDQYLRENRAKKPKNCGCCGFWKKNKCSLNYLTNPRNQPCSNGVTRSAMIRRGF
jgi:hypothetical protein